MYHIKVGGVTYTGGTTNEVWDQIEFPTTSVEVDEDDPLHGTLKTIPRLEVQPGSFPLAGGVPTRPLKLEKATVVRESRDSDTWTFSPETREQLESQLPSSLKH